MGSVDPMTISLLVIPGTEACVAGAVLTPHPSARAAMATPEAISRALDTIVIIQIPPLMTDCY
jgi:hypothetical protein